MTQPDPETARALLWRHGLPEDVIDGALCLHAQELAAVQRKEHDERRPYFHMGMPCTPGFGCHVGELIDLIDPTTDAPAEVSPTTDQTPLRDRIAEALWRASGPTAAEEANVDAVLSVLPASVDRAAVLREAADAVAEVRDTTDVNVAEYPRYDFRQRVALGDAEGKLRRMAREAEQPAAEPPPKEA